MDESLRAVRRALRKEQWAVAEELVGRAFADGLPMRSLGRVFTVAGKPELLVRSLWNHRDIMLNDVGTLAFFGRLAAKTDVADEYFSKLRQWALDRADQRSSFSHPDSLITYRHFDERVLAALFLVKYGSWDLDSPDDAPRKAARYADSFQIAPEIAEFFHGRCCDREIDFMTWLREFKVAQVLHQLFCDGSVMRRFLQDADIGIRERAAQFCRVASLEKHLDVEGARRTYEEVDRSRGLLLSTFHGSFVRISNFFYTTCMPDACWLTAKGQERSNIFIVEGNERAAAFRTFKALSQGRAVLMAPDGPHFADSAGMTIEVLGLKTKVSEGAAVLAYESKCDTGWISAIRQGNMFVPEYVPGPRRLEGESYRNFRDRWVSFYADRLHCALSSRPENLVLISRWASPHSQAWN
ncbi:MAG TPA: hypothetical protein VH370_09565 [Humisphaera sp.]|nr:hypothetical protein [Humisphaera sp.]